MHAAGPVNIHERVMRAMTRPSQNHRDPWFNPWFSSILEEVKTIFKTKEGTTFIFPGTGTGGRVLLLPQTHFPAAASAQHSVLECQDLQTRVQCPCGAQVAGSRP